LPIHGNIDKVFLVENCWIIALKLNVLDSGLSPDQMLTRRENKNEKVLLSGIPIISSNQ
jgi:hypothetical protein